LALPEVSEMRKDSKILLLMTGLFLAALTPFAQSAIAAMVLSIGDGDSISVLERGQN